MVSSLNETEVGDQFTSLEALIEVLAGPDCGLARVRGRRVRSGELLGWLETQAGLDSVQRARIQALFKRLSTNPSLLLFALRYTLTPDAPLELCQGVAGRSPAELAAKLFDAWPDIESPLNALGILAASGRLPEWLRASEAPGWEEVVQKIELAHTRYPGDLDLPGWLLLWAYGAKSPFPFNVGLVETPPDLARAIDASDRSREEGLRRLDAGWIRAWLITTRHITEPAGWDAAVQDTKIAPSVRLTAALRQLDPDRPAPALRATPAQLDFGTIRRGEQRQLELRLDTLNRESVACSLSFIGTEDGISLNTTEIEATPATLRVSVDGGALAGGRGQTAILVNGSGKELRVPVHFRLAPSQAAIARRFSPAVIMILLAGAGGLGWWYFHNQHHHGGSPTVGPITPPPTPTPNTHPVEPVPTPVQNTEETAYVNTIQLNVRNGPGPDYASLTKVPQGTPIRVLERRAISDDAIWARIEFQGVSGWVNTKLLSATPVAPLTTDTTPPVDVINPPLSSPSFNCAAATTQSESRICRDPGLRALDRDLAVLYNARRQGLSDASGKSLRDNQLRWLAERNKCGSDVGCLTIRYRERILWLKNSNGGTTAMTSGLGTSMRVNSPGDGFLALRSEPSTQSGFRVNKIPHGTELTLGECITTPTRDHWCKTHYLGKVGWVLDRYVKRF
jgi:uncharacterized protein YraI